MREQLQIRQYDCALKLMTNSLEIVQNVSYNKDKDEDHRNICALMQFLMVNSMRRHHNILSMFCSSDYSQFLEPETDFSTFMPQSSGQGRLDNPQYLVGQAMEAHHDLVYSQFTNIISKRLILQPYPNTFKNTNPFCPLCLKLVKNEDDSATCFIDNDRNYLIHSNCLEKDKDYQMKDVGDQLHNAVKIDDSPYHEHRKVMDFSTDTRHFFLEVAFCHPINDKAFFKISKKTTLCRNQFLVGFNEREDSSFFPNIVLLPLTDFQINVSVVEFGVPSNQVKYSKYVSLRHLKDKKNIKVQCEEVGFTAEIIQHSQEQNRLIQDMNYKYRFDSTFPFMRIATLTVNLPDKFEDDCDDDDVYIDTGSTLVDALLKEEEPSATSVKSTSRSPVKKRVFSSDSHNSSQDSPTSQKVNLNKLISSKGLLDFVKNIAQSRLFQNYLGECLEGDIEKVIEYLRGSFVELIMHQYGNYMVQKLFSVSNSAQRLRILENIQPNFCELIKNKQGTHTLQAFIDNFTCAEEFSFVSMEIRLDFYELCTNNNATHFIQKVVKTFPLEYTLPYFNYTVENLLAFALDKNAMCVIKHMMRRFRELAGQYEAYEPTVELIRRQLITHVTFSVDRLIMDSFGNYVIQFCYELFDLDKCAGITERILSKFAFYAVGKFSSNVILKCISSYWTDKKIYNTLRGLSNNQIVEIFRHKDGNKILLEIMQKLQGSELWDRLYSILIQVEPTRFYHDRWGVCLGSRSGQVGYRSHVGFPDPKKHHYKRK